MSLSPGNRLGPYEIVAPLGAGGMGEVYRAKDTRLGREVAVKVLPRHLSSNPDVRARFEREAKTVSALNHPNICTLHDVGREGDTDYLVMELIEGETLAARLTKGALPLADVLKFGGQIADALDRAHRAGVMHRDLKPGNVMITKSGAKLMDFGLARAVGLGTTSELTSSPTVVGPLTAEGTIIGTFQYMAPEQLEGKEADARADLWALGCVLYEMATGKRAFDGTSQASLIAAVMHVSPAPVSQVTSMSPPALDSLVSACLTKDPADRVQSAHDVKLQLDWMRDAGSKPAVGPGASAPVAARRGARPLIPWAVAAVALAVAAYSLFAGFSKPKELEPIRASINAPAGTTLEQYWSYVGLSPDGRNVAFSAGGPEGNSIWVRALGSDSAHAFPDTHSHGPMFWSADGRTLAYFDDGDGKLKKVAIDGGSPVTLCDAVRGRGGTWNRDGVIVFAPAQEGPLLRVSSDGGATAPVTTLDPGRHETAHRFPFFLPDGDHFLYATIPPGPDGWDTYVGSLKSKSVKKVLTARSAAVYAEPGYLVFAREGRVLAQRFDTGRLELAGNAVAIGNAPVYSDMDAEPVASASTNNRLIVLQNAAAPTKLQWLERSGAAGPALTVPAGPWKVQQLSPDGRRAGVTNGTDIWIVDLARSMPTRFAPTMSTESSLAWSPDGRRVAFTSNQTGRTEVYVASSDGAGSPELVPTTDAQFKYVEDWSPDGKFLVLRIVDPVTQGDIWLMPMDGGARKPEVYLNSPFSELEPHVSPDGRWLAYTSTETGAHEIYVQSFPKPGHKVRVSSDGGKFASWSKGGKDLFFVHDDTLMAVPVEAGDEFRPGTPKPLFKIPNGATGGDQTADGERFLFSVAAEPPHREIELFLDWTAGLEKR